MNAKGQKPTESACVNNQSFESHFLNLDTPKKSASASSLPIQLSILVSSQTCVLFGFPSMRYMRNLAAFWSGPGQLGREDVALVGLLIGG